MPKPAPTIVWLRKDLRLADNPALAEACARGGPVIPLFILDPAEPLGGASRWWLHHSLEALAQDCAVLGSPLVLRAGPPAELLLSLAGETGATTIVWNRRYEPQTIARDTVIKAALTEKGFDARSFNGSLLVEPSALRAHNGEPYKVFTPFWRTLAGFAPFAPPRPAPAALPAPLALVASDHLDDWSLLPHAPDWAAGLRATWQPGETAAAERLGDFLDVDVAAYPDARDRMDKAGTSRLAAHFHWGELSMRQAWQAAAMTADAHPASAAGVSAFQRQMAWREFSAHLLFHWPHLATRAWKPAYENFPWADNEEHFKAWAEGRTGYPVVDAAMRALWATGTMHNRARMIVASFLVKHLLIDWRRGADWFEDTLVDADLANNRAGWQWVAGSGSDASPYFRIFNPVLQGQKFDPDGTFVRQWVPELAGLDNRFIHQPWSAPGHALDEAGILPGETYPRPIIDHDFARKRALAALASMKKDQLAEV